MVSIRTLGLDYVDRESAAPIHQLDIEIVRDHPGSFEHTIRARLSEAVSAATQVCIACVRLRDCFASMALFHRQGVAQPRVIGQSTARRNSRPNGGGKSEPAGL